jgi:trimeric autotransporter adhesin
MATPRWKGKALPVAQVNTITVANTWAAADTVTLTMNGKAIVITIGATVTTAAVATAIKEAINGDTITGNATRSESGANIPEFAEVAATVLNSVVTVTGNTKGKPFTLTVTESTAGSGTATGAVATAASGPNHWNEAKNWDTGSVPVDGDTPYIDNSNVSILYGLDQSAVTLAALYVGQSFTGTIGLPEVNSDGTQYLEYRDQYLAVGATILQIGLGVGEGSGRIKINTGSVQTALSVWNGGQSLDTTLPAILWKGTHASNALVMRGGDVGIAVYGAEVATLATWSVESGRLVLGAGVTLSGALQQNGGDVLVNSLIDGSLTVLDGNTVIDGTGAVDQLTIRGGNVIYNTSGTLGGATVLSGPGVLDFSQDARATSVTNPIDMHGQQCRLADPNKRLGGVVIDLNEGATLAQVDLGSNIRVTRGATA